MVWFFVLAVFVVYGMLVHMEHGDSFLSTLFAGCVVIGVVYLTFTVPHGDAFFIGCIIAAAGFFGVLALFDKFWINGGNFIQCLIAGVIATGFGAWFYFSW